MNHLLLTLRLFGGQEPTRSSAYIVKPQLTPDFCETQDDEAEISKYRFCSNLQDKPESFLPTPYAQLDQRPTRSFTSDPGGVSPEAREASGALLETARACEVRHSKILTLKFLRN